jgi:hypothetical protein
LITLETDIYMVRFESIVSRVAESKRLARIAALAAEVKAKAEAKAAMKADKQLIAASHAVIAYFTQDGLPVVEMGRLIAGSFTAAGGDLYTTGADWALCGVQLNAYEAAIEVWAFRRLTGFDMPTR